MERFTHSTKVLWRSERLLLGNEVRQGTHKFGFTALAGLVAVFGLAMLGVAFFFALVPYVGYAVAALIVGVVDFLIAAVLVGVSRSVKPSPEVEMIREMRNMALNDLEDEVSQTEAELVAFKDGVTRFVRNPLEAIIPGAMGPLLGALTKGVTHTKRRRKK